METDPRRGPLRLGPESAAPGLLHTGACRKQPRRHARRLWPTGHSVSPGWRFWRAPANLRSTAVDLPSGRGIDQWRKHADGNGPPGVIINYNCQDYQCEPDLVERLTAIAQEYLEFVYLAPFPNMTAKIAVTRVGAIETFDTFDESTEGAIRSRVVATSGNRTSAQAVACARSFTFRSPWSTSSPCARRVRE
jgi:hypothetical protein